MTTPDTTIDTDLPAETPEDLYRLLYAVLFPETVDGWDDDPDTVPGGGNVSEAQDARNSRPEPY